VLLHVVRAETAAWKLGNCAVKVSVPADAAVTANTISWAPAGAHEIGTAVDLPVSELPKEKSLSVSGIAALHGSVHDAIVEQLGSWQPAIAQLMQPDRTT